MIEEQFFITPETLSEFTSQVDLTDLDKVAVRDVLGLISYAAST